MPKRSSSKKNSESLRRRAEERLEKQTARLESLSKADMKELVHELGTHQIELEMQNEELRQAQTELEESRGRYSDLYDLAPTGYATLGEEGAILEANLTLARLLGRERRSILNKPFADFVDGRDRSPFLLHCSTIFEKLAKQTVEVRLRRKDGTEFPARLESVADGGHGARPTSLRMAISDITDRKRAEEALQHERDLLQAVMNGARNSHLVYLDRDFNFVCVNEAYAKTCGYRPEEMVGKNHFALYPHAENEAIFRRVRDTGQPFEVHDKPFMFPDQPERGVTYWDWTLSPVMSASDAVEGLIFSLHETTERKRIEQEREKSEELFRRAIENAPIPVIMHAEDGEVLQISSSWTELTGYRLTDLPTLDAWLSRAYGEGADVVRDHVRALFKGDRRSIGIEFPIRTKDGAIRHWSFNASSPGKLRDGRRFIVGMAVDITERKAAEEAVQREKAFSESVIECLPGVFYLFDAQGKFLKWNRNFERVTGYSAQELAGMHPWDFFQGDDKALIQSRVAEVFAKGESEAEADFVSKDGRRMPYLFTGLLTTIDGTKCLIGIGSDISERKKADESLRESEARFRSLTENSPDCIALHDGDLRHIYVNPAISRLVGRTQEDFVGKTVLEMGMPKEAAEQLDGLLRRTRDSGSEQVGELTFSGQSGPIFFQWRSVPVAGQETSVSVMTIATDITNRKLTEEEIKRSVDELRKANEDLERFNRVAVGRELRMVELKKEVNELLRRLGEEKRYPLDFEEKST